VDLTGHPEKTAPGVIAALSQLGKAIDESGLEKSLTELIKLRASQMNGCAFCLQFHLNLARKIQLPQHKIDLLAAWRDTEIYSARERATGMDGSADLDVATAHRNGGVCGIGCLVQPDGNRFSDCRDRCH
jgi:AhpD family alkylhydroperoxidase